MGVLLLIALFIITDGLGYDGFFSPNKVHMQQTDALLAGHLYLSQNIQDLKADNVWHNDSVEQVWGLGVPALRLPFYAVAHLFGYNAFPDLIILFFYIFACLYSIGIASYLWLHKKGIKEAGIWAALCMLAIALFPPVLMIMRSRFIVYEETITYGYFYSVFLFSLLLMQQVKKHSLKTFFAIALLAGCAGLLRPTLFAYAVPVYAASLLIVRRHISKMHMMRGMLLFSFGVALLMLTNYVRFGHVGEFGHHINVAADLNSVNLTRFQSEYTQETPFASKLAETFGALFLVDAVPVPNGLYMSNIVPFQMEAIRWRHISFPSIHWYYLIAFIILSLYMRRDALIFVPVASFTLLFVFYAHSFMISSRYMIDFAASFAIAFVLALLLSAQSRNASRMILCTVLLSGIYIAGFIKDAPQVMHPAAAPITATSSAMQLPQADTSDIPDAYRRGIPPAHIPFNAMGWNYLSGKLNNAAIFFISLPREITLSLRCVRGTCEEVKNELHAELDGTYLAMTSYAQTGEYMQAVFEVPESLRNTSAIQALFIQTQIIKKKLEETSFLLESVEWK